MKRKLAVIGLGSAGIQTLCHFLCWLNEEWEITSIHDPDINIVGIGESTNPPFINAIEWGLDFDIINDLENLDGTLKYGTKYKQWRENHFVNPLLSGNVAAHINTFKLKEFAIPRLRSIWGDKFKEITGKVERTDNLPDKVVLTVDNTTHIFECVIDCTGFPKHYEEYTLIKDSPLNHALIHNKEPYINSTYEPTYTGHYATPDGWMFEVPLSSRTSYGYMFNDNITSVEEAKRNFSNEINVDLSEVELVQYKFNSYYINKIVDGRVFKNGNAAVFFEPMFANSLWMYDKINRFIFDYIISATSAEVANNRFTDIAKDVEGVIAYHYHGGSVYNTKFWRYASSISKKKLDENKKFKDITPILQRYTRNKLWEDKPEWAFGPKQLVKLDKNFKYNYFK